MASRIKTSFASALIALSLITFTSCEEVVDQIDPKSETEKTIEVFTEGGLWNVDTLVTKTDLFGNGNSTITSDTTHINYGTIEFQKPNQTVPGYGSGFMIHRYSNGGINYTDTSAWVPYNFNSGTDGTITLFFSMPGEDFVVNAYDMYLNLDAREDKKIIISGWRRITIPGGSGGSYGTYRRYHLTR
jgi:hypothetical protein